MLHSELHRCRPGSTGDHHSRYRVTLTIESVEVLLQPWALCDGSLAPNLPDLFQPVLKKIGEAGDEATAMVQPMQLSSQALVFYLWVLARVARLYVIVIASNWSSLNQDLMMPVTVLWPVPIPWFSTASCPDDPSDGVIVGVLAIVATTGTLSSNLLLECHSSTVKNEPKINVYALGKVKQCY